MSVGEVVGLAITVGLLGAIAGGVVIVLVAGGSDRLETTRARQADGFGRWLAARLTLTRSASSFIAAFRALASEPRDSSFWALRTDEAQQARTRLFAAMRELDLAQTILIARVTDPVLVDRLESFAPVTPEALRAAINGDSRDAAVLIGRLRVDDQRARALVKAALGEITPGPSRSQKVIDRLTILMRSMVDQWRGC